MNLIFPILTFFAGKMTSQSLRQILLLVLWDILREVLNDLVTQIWKLKKISEKYLSAQKTKRLEIGILLLKIALEGLGWE